MRLLLSFASLLTLAVGVQDSLDQGPRVQAIREVLMGSTPGTESAHFRLDYLDAGSLPGGGPFGAVRWLNGPARGVENTWRAECEVLLLDSGQRVCHLEQLGPSERILSYRELTGSYGRRLQVTWSADGSVIGLDKVGRQRRRREYSLGSAASFPLALVELARRGQALPQKMMVYQPLAGEFEELTIEVLPGIESRTLRLLRKDGSSAGSYRFEGNRLISFRWQAGGVIATRIDRQEYLHLAQPAQAIEASAIDLGQVKWR